MKKALISVFIMFFSISIAFAGSDFLAKNIPDYSDWLYLNTLSFMPKGTAKL